MKIFYHDQFSNHYAHDPAAEPGRLDPALATLKAKYPVFEPQPAAKEEVLLAHSEQHFERIAADQLLCNTALLAAGSALTAAETAMKGEHAFALCRPPGHHASYGSCWGFCYFNNVAIAVRSLLQLGEISSAIIVDFDLHYGDGTANIFKGEPAVSFWHSQESSPKAYIEILDRALEDVRTDLVAVSAGFDRGVDDWGGMLTAADYKRIGSLLGRYADKNCEGRLFAVLEGGYNARALAKNIAAFLEGLSAD